MAQIDITTAQKITITYDLATIGERLLALLIDLVIIVVYGLGVLIFVSIFWIENINLLLYLFVLPVVTFYTLCFELFRNGQTPGKMIMGLRVVRIDGRRSEPSDLLIRWVFRLIDIWVSLGSVALILISSSDKNQRLGDLLANTAVIKTRSKYGHTLAGLLYMHRREQYNPVFESAIQMSEEDMLNIKTLVDRLDKYPNEGHLRALDIASENIARKLNIPLEPYHPYFETNPFIRETERKKRLEFLNRLLKDYIILTR